MNRDKFMEAIFASFPDMVLYRHKPVVMPTVILLLGAAALLAQRGMDETAPLRMGLLLASVAFMAIGAVMLLSRLFGRGVPYYVPGKCFLAYETMKFGADSRDAVLKALRNGSFAELSAIPEGDASVITVALYSTPGHGFSVAMAFSYQDLEYKPLTDALRLG